MAIYSCDHGDYIVVYDGYRTACPVCDLKDKLEDAGKQIEDLKTQE